MPCSVKDYIEREKRLIDISILAGCHVLLMNPPLPPSLREDAFSGNGKEIVYLSNGRVTAQLDSILVRRRVQLDCAFVSFLRFHKLIN